MIKVPSRASAGCGAVVVLSHASHTRIFAGLAFIGKSCGNELAIWARRAACVRFQVLIVRGGVGWVIFAGPALVERRPIAGGTSVEAVSALFGVGVFVLAVGAVLDADGAAEEDVGA